MSGSGALNAAGGPVPRRRMSCFAGPGAVVGCSFFSLP